MGLLFLGVERAYLRFAKEGVTSLTRSIGWSLTGSHLFVIIEHKSSQPRLNYARPRDLAFPAAENDFVEKAYAS